MATIPTRTTDDSANDHVADHNVLAGAFNDQVIFLSPAEFIVGALGTAETSALNSIAPAWLLDAATDEGILAAVELPADWTTFHVDAVWAPSSSAAGDVRLRAQVSTFADAEVLPAFTTVGTVTETNPGTAYTATVTRLVSGQTAVADETLVLQILRLGSDVLDTYGADVGLIGVRLTKVS
jgi:hypothetical protein